MSNNKYLKKFIETKGEKIKEKIKCEECEGTYSYFNKSHHSKTSRHIKAIKQKEDEKKLKDLHEFIEQIKDEDLKKQIKLKI